MLRMSGEFEDIDLNEQINFADQQQEYGTFEQELEPPTYSAILASYFSPLWEWTKEAILYFTSVATTVPSAFFGLVLTTGGDPSIIGAAWWVSLSMPNKIFSIVNAAVVLTVGTLSRLKYFPEAVVQLKLLLKRYTASFTEFTKSNLVLLFSIAAAIAAGALAYDGFVWAGELAAIMSALANIIVVGGIRIVSVSALFARIIDCFDKDEQFRHICIEQLKTLQEQYRVEFDNFLQGRELSEETVREFLMMMHERALKVENDSDYITGKNPSLFLQSDLRDKTLQTLGKTGDWLCATGFGSAFFLLFGQKGFDGVKIIANLFSPTYVPLIDNLSYPSKLGIVFMGGVASGALGFVCGLEVREYMAKLYRHLKKHPEHIPTAGILFLACLLSATSITAAALSVTEKENLFGLETWGVGGLLFNFLNTTLFVAFDFIASSRHLFFKKVENAAVDTDVDAVKNVKKWLKENKLSPASTQAVRQMGYFAKPKPQPDRQMVPKAPRMAFV